MKLTRVGALAASAVFVFAACSGTPAASEPAASDGGTGAKPAVCENKKGTSSNEIHVYSSLPRQGSNTAQTNALVESIKQQLDGKVVGDFTIKYTDLDDSSAANNGDWDGAVAQANATTAANDPDAMVFIGHFNSGAAKLTIPILNAACLVMISPANTYPGLTTSVEGVTEPGEPDSYYPNGYRNYTRVIATDDKQGGAGAAWAKELGATKAYVLDDTQVYGKGLARAWALFADSARHRGRQCRWHERRLRREGHGLRGPRPEGEGLGRRLHLHRLHHGPEHGQALEGPSGGDAGHQDHVR